MAEEFNTDSMLAMFLYESGQLLEKLEGIILEKQDAECFDDADINEIFRCMHTIKGSSGVLMYENLTKVSHKLEDVFYYLRESHPENVPHLELVEKVLAVSDFINGELDKIKNGDSPDGDESQLVKDLDEFLSRIKGEIKKQGIRLPKANKKEEPTQFYVAPVELRSQGYGIATLTDVATGMPDELHKSYFPELMPYFDMYVSSLSCGYRKPNPKGLRDIAEHFGVSPDEMIFIGDEEKDIIVAKRFGCGSALIDRKGRGEQFGQDYTVTDLNGLFENIIL